MINKRYALLGFVLPLAVVSDSDNSAWANNNVQSPAPIPFHAATLPDFAGLIARLRPQVLNIRVDGASRGSGFIAHPDGYLLTALHVVQGSKKVIVTLDSSELAEASVVTTDEAADLAVLKLTEKRGWRALALQGESGTRLAEWLLVLGNPFGRGPTASVGVVGSVCNALAGKTGQVDWIQTDASINPGNSGGPVINSRGQVIGVATARISPGQGVGFITPIAHGRRLLHSVLMAD